MVKASVIILNYNGKQYLKRCIDSVLKQTYKDFEVIFVDNASADGSYEYIERLYKKKIRLIKNDQNYGFTGGNNIGYAAAKGEFVILLNNDTAVEEDWLKNLLAPMKDKRVSIVGSWSYNEEKAEAFLKNPDSEQSITLSGEPIARKRLSKDKHLLDVFFVSGNGMLIRKSRFKKPFDDDYFAYSEDTYICWLAQIRGERVVLNLNARMYHLGAGTKKITSKKFNSFVLTHGHKNQMMNYLLFYEWKNIIRIFPLFVFTQVGHLIDNPRKLWIKIKALWWILTHFYSIMRKRKEIQKQRKIKDKQLLPQISGKFFDERIAEHHYHIFYQDAVKLLNKSSLFYCKITRLNVNEFS